MDGEGPQIRVEQIGRSQEIDGGVWRVVWGVENLGDEAIEIISARVPHGKFRGKEIEFRPPVRIDPGKSAPIELSIACNATPGSAVENAFLILMTEWSKAQWRFFARFLVQVDRDGTPRTTTELITAQKAGFSGVSD